MIIRPEMQITTFLSMDVLLKDVNVERIVSATALTQEGAPNHFNVPVTIVDKYQFANPLEFDRYISELQAELTQKYSSELDFYVSYVKKGRFTTKERYMLSRRLLLRRPDYLKKMSLSLRKKQRAEKKLDSLENAAAQDPPKKETAVTPYPIGAITYPTRFITYL